MQYIGIVDDKEIERRTLVRSIRTSLTGEWTILDISPLGSAADYLSWIAQYKISVLILDEKLHEVDYRINYDGHDVVDYIRLRIPTLPIFVITAHSKDEDLQLRFKDVEGILERGDYIIRKKEYVKRFERASQKYSEVFNKELNTLSEIAGKIVDGTHTEADVKLANSIRNKLAIAFDVERIMSKKELLDKYAQKIDLLEKLKKETEEYLNK